MTKTCGTKVKLAISLLFVFYFIFMFAAPTPVYAASNNIENIDVVVDIAQNGDATVSMLWTTDVRDKSSTEFYITLSELGEKEVRDLTVSENGVLFEDIGKWNVDASREQKAQKSGIASNSKGYELCWGLGSNGAHTFTVQYTLTNLVQLAEDANFLVQPLVGDYSGFTGKSTITVRSEGLSFTPENTKIWAGGGTDKSTIHVENGVIFAQSPGGGNVYPFSVLAQFDEGMFAPSVQVNKTFEQIKSKELKGTDYDSTFMVNIKRIFRSLLPFLSMAGVGLISLIGMAAAKASNGDRKKMKAIYKNADYYRELPYEGNLVTTYSRLSELKQLSNECDIIGAYLLKWLQENQVEVVAEASGSKAGKEQDSIVLYPLKVSMGRLEADLYSMLQQAAGRDQVLQAKEFERWSKKNYSIVQKWLGAYKNQGQMNLQTSKAVMPGKARLFGFIPVKASVISEKGDELTSQMFGFKKYLLDFTIINEREAREVTLWGQYLVFAQVFGVAEQVAKQFEKLYPDYFVQMAEQHGGISMYDVIVYRSITNSFSRSMYRGYHAGYSASVQATRSSGGGGFASGGGGGFSGGGGHSGGSR